MEMGSARKKLFILSVLSLALFTLISYSVAKESWQQFDFDTTVKLQDHLSRRFDEDFSYFSIIGSAEVTFAIAGILALLSLVRLKILAFIGWLMIIPASMVEVFGKLVLYHPGPPVLFHRNVLEHSLPSFYVHTNYSYPSGHMTRTIFLVTVLIVIMLLGKNRLYKLPIVLGLLFFAFMMSLTRVYLGEHWLSDVVGGSILGIATGLFSAGLIIRSQGQT